MPLFHTLNENDLSLYGRFDCSLSDDFQLTYAVRSLRLFVESIEYQVSISNERINITSIFDFPPNEMRQESH